MASLGNDLVPIVTVTVDDANQVAVTTYVDNAHPIHVEMIDLDPMPTWPSPTEAADLIANAVREAWLRQHEYYAG